MWWPWTSARVDFHKELGPATSSVRRSHQFAIQLSLKHQLFHLASYANRSRVYGSVDISAEHGRMLLFKQEEPCAGCLFILAGTRLWRGRVWVGGSHGKTRGRMISETDVRMRIWANNMGLQRRQSSWTQGVEYVDFRLMSNHGWRKAAHHGYGLGQLGEPITETVKWVNFKRDPMISLNT